MSKRKSDLKTIVLLMVHMGYDMNEIEENIDAAPFTIKKIISDHRNRNSPQRREEVRCRRRRQRHNKARRKILVEQQRNLTTGDLPSVD